MRVGPRSEGNEETHHARSLVKSNRARLHHFMLTTSVPFYEITPTKFGNRDERCYTSKIYVNSYLDRQRNFYFSYFLLNSCDGLACLFFNMSFGFFGPELMATLFQSNPRSEVRMKDANEQAFKYRNLE
ncbi:hypothetical protein TNCV_400031 [Trichonephila clavipes]|nr:hypothetical protein TNCV_400031 [Trichonephila clavipes]